MTKIRLVLAEDHHLVREGLKMLLGNQSDMEIVGEAGDGRAALELARELEPDVVVMDVSMPVMNGLAATARLNELCPDVKVLTLTRHTDAGFLHQLLGAGASGYVLKQSAPAELLRAVRTVASGAKYLDPAVTGTVISGFSRLRSAADEPPRREPSERETEVLRLIAHGFSNKEIAARLELSVKTVEVHKANAMKKLGMRSRIDIVRYAVLRGWLHDM
jgi:two-component system response regulator NreC